MPLTNAARAPGGGDQDPEAETPETMLPEVATEARPEATILPWRGRGNVIAAVGVALLDLARVR